MPRSNKPRPGRRSSPRADSLSPPRTAFDDALRSLAYRRLSEGEVRERLGRKHGAADVEEAVAKLKEYRFLDDDALIADYARDRLRHSPRSAELIEAELERRGIAAEHFRRIFAPAFPEYDPLETALYALKAQFKGSALKKLKESPPQSRREKVLRFLKSRGFDYETMQEAWEEFRGKIPPSPDDNSEDYYLE